MSEQSFRILIVAGEASGDLHGAGLVEALHKRQPRLVFEGVGGERMQRAGVDLLCDIRNLGAMGVFEMASSLRSHARLYRQLSRCIARGRYHAAILINYPGFNLLLSKRLKAANCPVLFYIGPQIWASRPGRMQTMKRTLRKMYSVLPFEVPLYQDAGVDVAYHGHPFVDLVRPQLSEEEAREEFDLREGLPVVGLMPGSRNSEIRYLLDDMLQAAVRIKDALGDCRFLLPVADTLDAETIRQRVSTCRAEVQVVSGRNYEVMRACDFLILASGSATLEAALFECPMVIVYRVNALSYFLFRWLVNIRWFGLVNIVAGEEVAPELLNEQVTPQKIAEEALSVLQNPEKKQTVRKRMHRVREMLGEPGVLDRIAEDMEQVLGLKNTSE